MAPWQRSCLSVKTIWGVSAVYRWFILPKEMKTGCNDCSPLSLDPSLRVKQGDGSRGDGEADGAALDARERPAMRGQVNPGASRIPQRRVSYNPSTHE